MKNLKIVLTIMVFAVLAGCQSTNKLYNSSAVDNPGKVKHDRLEADIRVDDTKKIKGTSNSTYFLMFRLEGDSEYADGINYSSGGSSGGGAGSLLKTFFGFLNPLNLVNKIISGDAKEKVISAAAHDALSGTGADFIANPTYSYTKKDFLIIQKFEATIEGYPGFYSNFRSYDPVQRALDQNLSHQVNKKIVSKLQIGDGLDK